MRGWLFGLVFVGLLAATCSRDHHPTMPTAAVIQGRVTYPGGSPVGHARLVANNQDTTYADTLGFYLMELPLSPDTVSVEVDNLSAVPPGPLLFHFVGGFLLRPDHDQVINVQLQLE